VTAAVLGQEVATCWRVMERERAASRLVVVAALAFCGCATQPTAPTGGPGFLLALWHGLIAPLALVGALLHWLVPDTPVGAYFAEVRVYAWPNTGPFYDLGFVLGLSAWGEGAAAVTWRGDHETPEELGDAQGRIRRLRRKVRRLRVENWQLRNRGQS
jgi:hypothetical protein